MTFEGLTDGAPVASAYNGGAGGNFGVTVNGGIAFASGTGTGPDFSGNPSGTQVMGLDPTPTQLNIPGGFYQTVSFYYSSDEPFAVDLFDGVGGTGTRLTTQNVPSNAPNTNCQSGIDYCVWTRVTVNFSGRARSVVFRGPTAVTLLDDVSFQTAVSRPATVPSMSIWALVVLTLLMGAYASMRRVRG